MNSATRLLTYGDLERFLTAIGFSREPARSDCLLFHHDHPDVLIVLPPRQAEDAVDAVHLAAVRTHVVANGLLDAPSFELLLRATEPPAASE